MAMLIIAPARVVVKVVSSDIEKTVPLADLLAGHTIDGQPVYKMGCHCYNCPAPDAGGCSYIVALDYAIDGGNWVTDGAWCDALPLPLCPGVRDIAAGKMTWADVFKRYWPDGHWQTVYGRYDIDNDAAMAACNAYAAWQAAQK
mgnify:CR=1 FL=1